MLRCVVMAVWALILTWCAVQMDELRKERDNDDDAITSYELDDRLAEERSETAKQLDSMKAQVRGSASGVLGLLG